MQLFQIISTFWLDAIGSKLFDYTKGIDWEGFGFWTGEYIFFSLWTAITSVSGLIVYPEKGLIELLFIASVLGIILDFLSLSFIASKNQTFLQNHPEKISKNKTFIVFFLLWRFFLPDFFAASSIAAYIARMNLSKKQIFMLVTLAQVLRISVLYVIYKFYI